MNEPQQVASLGAQESGLKDELSFLPAMRLLRRTTDPIGVIDVRHPERLYARTITWLRERFPLLEQVLARYGELGAVSFESGGFVFKTMVESGEHDKGCLESSPMNVLPRLTESPFSSLPSSFAGGSAPSYSPELFRVSRRPHLGAGPSSVRGGSNLRPRAEEEIPQANHSIPRAKAKADVSVESVTGGQSGAPQPSAYQLSSNQLSDLPKQMQVAELSPVEARSAGAEGGLVLQKTRPLPKSVEANSLRQSVKAGGSAHITAQSSAGHTVPTRDEAQVGKQVEQMSWLLSRMRTRGHHPRVPLTSEEANVNLPLQFQSQSQIRQAVETGGSRKSSVVAPENHMETVFVNGQQMVWQTQARSIEKVEEALRHLGRQVMAGQDHEVRPSETIPGLIAQTHMVPEPAAGSHEAKLDIGALAEKVSRAIARQLSVDRERRGESRWPY